MAQPTIAQCPVPPDVTQNVQKQTQEATAWLKRAKSNEERAKALNNRAHTYFVLRKFDLAIKDRETERSLTGKVFCQRCLAEAYMANGQYDKAIGEMNEVHQRRKLGNYSHLCYRGMAYYLKGDYPSALKDFEDTLLDRDDFKFCGMYGRGLVKIKTGDAAGGRADIAATIAADATAKYKIDYPYLFCIHGIVGG